MIIDAFDEKRAQKLIGFQFQNSALLKQALSHRSVGSENNERLEFLGDAILGFVIADALFQRFPETDEGKLSRLRSSLVNQKSLAALSQTMQLGELLLMGPGELKSGGFRRQSILSDALEAIIGAIYLDQGYVQVRDWIERLFANRLKNLDVDLVLKDPKTRLQERQQGLGRPLPKYTLLETTGLAHDQTFLVACELDGLKEPIRAKGASIRQAEQAAARKVLECISDD